MRSEHETEPIELSWAQYLDAVSEDLPHVRERAAAAGPERRRLVRAADAVAADCTPGLPDSERPAAVARWRELLLDLSDAVSARRLRWWSEVRLAGGTGIYPLTRREMYAIALSLIAALACIVLAAVSGTARGIIGWLVIAAVWLARAGYLSAPVTRRRRAARGERRLDRTLRRKADRTDR